MTVPFHSNGNTLRHRRIAALLLLAGWLTSLALPAIGFRLDSDGSPTEGIVALLGGWLVALRGVMQPHYPANFGWFANPAFSVVLVLMVGRLGPARARALRISGWALLLFALVTLDLLLRPRADPYEIYLKVSMTPTFRYSDNGVAVGYYVWLATNLFAAAAALHFARMQDR